MSAALVTLPHCLRELILIGALQSGGDHAIKQLIAMWPQEVFHVRKYLSTTLTSPPTLSQLSMPGLLHSHRRKLEGYIMEQISCWAHTFTEFISQHVDTKLHHLDLTGHPLNQDLIRYLASQVISLYYENCHNKLSQKYKGRKKESNQVYQGRTRCEIPDPQLTSQSLSFFYEDCQKESNQVYKGRTRREVPAPQLTSQSLSFFYEDCQKESNQVYKGRTRREVPAPQLTSQSLSFFYEDCQKESNQVYKGRTRREVPAPQLTSQSLSFFYEDCQKESNQVYKGRTRREVPALQLTSQNLSFFYEDCQNETNQVYKAVAPQSAKSSLVSTPSSHQYILSIDALIENKATHNLFCRAVTISRRRAAPLRLRVFKLDICDIGLPLVIHLLNLLEPEYIVGVSLRMIKDKVAMKSAGLKKLCPLLMKFNHLSALDLSGNQEIVLSPKLSTTTVLGETLGALPHLRRLNCSGIHLDGCVGPVLCKLRRPLLALGLSGCHLSTADVLWLSTNLVTSHLEDLHIGYNDMHTSVQSVLSLLNRTSVLQVLELSGTRLAGASVDRLFESLVGMTELRGVKMERNKIKADQIFKSLDLLIKVKRLRVVVLDAPSDLVAHPDNIFNDDDDLYHVEHQAGIEFDKRVNKLLQELSEMHQRPTIRLEFVRHS